MTSKPLALEQKCFSVDGSSYHADLRTTRGSLLVVKATCLHDDVNVGLVGEEAHCWMQIGADTARAMAFALLDAANVSDPHEEDSLRHFDAAGAGYALSRHIPDMARGFTINTNYGELPIEAGQLADLIARHVQNALQAVYDSADEVTAA